MGFAGAYVAQAYDPSAIYFNAAGAAFLKGTQIYLSGGLRGASAPISPARGPTPRSGPSRRPTAASGILPSLYYTHQVAERLGRRGGLLHPVRLPRPVGEPRRVHRPLHLHRLPHPRRGTSTPSWPTRSQDRLAMGAGARPALRELRPPAAPAQAEPNPFPEPTDVAELTDRRRQRHGFGWNAGILASPSESFSIGLALPAARSARSTTGTADFNQILTGDDGGGHGRGREPAPAPAGAGEPRLPLDSLGGGIAYEGAQLDARGRPRLDLLVELRQRDVRPIPTARG